MEISGPMTPAPPTAAPLSAADGHAPVAAPFSIPGGPALHAVAPPPAPASLPRTLALFLIHSLLIGAFATLIALVELRVDTPWPYVIIGVVFASLGALLQISLAWIYFPVLHRGGSLTAGVLAALHPVARTTHWLILLALVPVGFVESRDYLHDFAEDMGVMMLLLLMTSSAWTYIALLSRAVHRAAPAIDELRCTPRCDRCGYDLSHAGRLCPECNLPVEDSLLPDRRRTGQRWDRTAESWLTWAMTSLTLLLRPGRFFPRLEVRTPPAAARRFRNLHLRWMAAVARPKYSFTQKPRNGCCQYRSHQPHRDRKPDAGDGHVRPQPNYWRSLNVLPLQIFEPIFFGNGDPPKTDSGAPRIDDKPSDPRVAVAHSCIGVHGNRANEHNKGSNPAPPSEPCAIRRILSHPTARPVTATTQTA